MRPHILLILIAYLLAAGVAAARAQESALGDSHPAQQDTGDLRSYLEDESDASTLSGDFDGLGERLNAIGINTTLNLWLLYQGNVSGGLTTSADFNGLLYFSNFFDFEKLFDWKGASLLFRIDGRWGTGVDDAVGSLTNINTLTVGDEPIGVTRLWFNQNWFDDRLRLRFGKLDITTENFDFHDMNTAFDAMDFANSPRTQFLAGSLVNNSTIPFPASGLGAMMLYEPAERVYVAGGAIPSDSMEYEWSNPFTSDSPWLFTAEAGTVVAVGADGKPGHYYAGIWGSAPFFASDTHRTTRTGSRPFSASAASTEAYFRVETTYWVSAGPRLSQMALDSRRPTRESWSYTTAAA